MFTKQIKMTIPFEDVQIIKMGFDMNGFIAGGFALAMCDGTNNYQDIDLYIHDSHKQQFLTLLKEKNVDTELMNDVSEHEGDYYDMSITDVYNCKNAHTQVIFYKYEQLLLDRFDIDICKKIIRQTNDNEFTCYSETPFDTKTFYVTLFAEKCPQQRIAKYQGKGYVFGGVKDFKLHIDQKLFDDGVSPDGMHRYVEVRDFLNKAKFPLNKEDSVKAMKQIYGYDIRVQ
jgi:hypothetical protein